MRLTFLGSLLGAAAVALIATMPAPTSAQSSGPITLRAVLPFTPNYAFSNNFFIFQKLANEKLKGKLNVSYIGGAEVVPAFEQFEAVRDGAVDMSMAVGAYYRGQVPEAAAPLGARKSPPELRANGFLELMREVHKKQGVHLLAYIGGTKGDAYRLYSNVKITKADLTGVKMRVSPTYIPLVKALGGTAVNMAPGEVYTALERKVVDGFGWTYLGIGDYGMDEVTKYVIDHPFYSTDVYVLVNLKKWESLPADIRATLEEVGIQAEKDAIKYITKSNAKEDKALKRKGIEFIKLPPDEEKKFLAAAYDAHWADIIGKSPQIGPKLKALAE